MQEKDDEMQKRGFPIQKNIMQHIGLNIENYPCCLIEVKKASTQVVKRILD